MKPNYHRREFLKKAVTAAVTIVLTPFVANSISRINQSKGESGNEKLIPHINPAFRIQRLNDESLELYTYQKVGSKISYYYSGFEAGVLLVILENKLPEENLKELATRYSLSDSICKTKIYSAMDEFKKKGLIYYGDLMMVKKNEVTYE